jgi:mannose-6-phosphate isomerase class I
MQGKVKRRSGRQAQMPSKIEPKAPGHYDIYPYHALGGDKIHEGYHLLAVWLSERKFVALDGYVGVFWDDVRLGLEAAFKDLRVSVKWVETKDYLRDPVVVQLMVAPYLGTQKAIWGTRCKLDIKDFYHHDIAISHDENYQLTIVLGTAATIIAPTAAVVYFDLPKNELQLRMRAGSVKNLGNNIVEDPAEMYKRFYFVDWVVLNEHKKRLFDKIEVFADTQWDAHVNWITAADLKAGMQAIAGSMFRVRPWFEPGVWGGQWMKKHIPATGKKEVNLAWSFELIVPENGLVFESDGNLLEVSFDMLMFSQHKMVLGRHADQYGYDFPIRFDFLDTWQGGNLSIQCHPSLPYIKKHFGESITQDETYYILDCDENASVYLGFQDDIDPLEFRKQLEQSRDHGTEMEMTRYVQAHQAKKHDLFLIPNGTVHSAGAGNLVLEISATPYIFTFKMYDWLRLDLNGKPRAINIEHAFNNLNFDRKGAKVEQELISKPYVICRGNDWQVVHLPTHSEHFYDVHRVEFDTSISIATEELCHVLMLVEGTSIEVTTASGVKMTFYYAETFVIPAGAGHYTLANMGGYGAKVIKAFLKL